MPSHLSDEHKATSSLSAEVRPVIHVTRAPPRPTLVFDTYWRFACKRQELFFKKLRNPNCPPWTDDPILRRHKFTNAYRASDRVSQYLIRKVIYTPDLDLQRPEEVFFRRISLRPAAKQNPLPRAPIPRRYVYLAASRSRFPS